MSVEARISPSWAGRWLLIAVSLLGFAGWYAYDAQTGYPRENQEAAARQEAPPYSERDIAVQWMIAGGCLVLSVVVLMRLAVHFGRRWSADETGLRGPRGLDLSYDRITAIDKTRWDRKGIAVVHYQTPSGEAGAVKLDAWVFRGADCVLAEVERQTGLTDHLAH